MPDLSCAADLVTLSVQGSVPDLSCAADLATLSAEGSVT